MAQSVGMPIEFKCTNCKSVLRVDETGSGKRARCPHCQFLNLIPKTKPPEPDKPSASQQFFIDSVSGSVYGPITKRELDQWVHEGRISGDCVVRPSGAKMGQLAGHYYPGLQPAQQVTLEKQPELKIEDSYSAGGLNPKTSKRVKATGYTIIPTAVDFELIILGAVQLFQKNAWMLSITALICLLPAAADSVCSAAGIELDPIPQILLDLVRIYLSIGQTRLALQVSRGQPATFSTVYSGGDKFLPIIFFTFLAYIALTLGFLVLILPGVLLLLYLWPSYFLIIDDHADVLGSLGMAKDICTPNVLTTFLLGLTSMGILIAGLLLCGFGVIPASGFVSVLWAVSYLAMSGQVSFK